MLSNLIVMVILFSCGYAAGQRGLTFKDIFASGQRTLDDQDISKL